MPAIDDPINTLVGEVKLLVYQIKELDKKFDTIASEMKEMKGIFVTKDTYKTLEERVVKIENAVWWTIRTIVGLIITLGGGGLISFLFTKAA